MIAAVLTRCASAPPPTRPTGGPTRAPAPAFSSPAEAEAALVELEDRRAFDEALLATAAAASDASTRARAALSIGRISDDRGAALLRKLLTDGAVEVRAAAAFACQAIGDATLTPDLIPLLGDRDAGAAAAAARAIGFLARGDGEDALIAAIPRATSPQPRAAMLESLWRFANTASQSAALAFAADPDRGVRVAALYALARKPIEGSLPALTAALEDPTAPVFAAAYAARALGILGKRESLPPLAHALDGAKTPLVINALVSLEAILEKDPGASLSADRKQRVVALAGEANPNVAAPALVLLRQFAAVDHEAFRRLWSIATTGEGRRRQIALQSITAVLKKRADKALEAAIDSSDPALRAAAAESLVFLTPADAKTYRDRLASDKDALVRLAVLSSLRTLEAVRENRALVNSALTDADPGVRAAAIEALGVLNDGAVLSLVADAVTRSQGDAGPDVAIAAIGVCEKLRSDPAARAIVESLYRQQKTLVARLARRALVQVLRGDPAALPNPEYKTGRTRADYASLLADAKKRWQAQVETARGTFAIRLAGETAPLTVANFVRLARSGFFDGVRIHRVVPNFVLQDGDPTATGNGGPGYEIRDELSALEYARGTVGMALSGPDTGGSQWFVTHSPQPHLNGLYTIFGQVTVGQEIVERVEQGDRITRVTVTEIP